MQTPRVICNQVQKEPLDRLQRMFGGSLRLQKPRGFANAKPQWKWLLCGGRAAGVMITLFLFMSPDRKSQIRKALTAWKSGPRGPYKVKNGNAVSK